MKLTCNCCFDDEININNAVVCSKDHVACTDCISRAVKIAVGENSVVRCFTGTCDEVFPDNIISRAFPFDETIKTAYGVILQRHSMKEASLDNLYACPFCDNEVIIEDQRALNFRCNGCSKESCRNCRQLRHDGDCLEIHSREEMETEKFILRCLCGVALVRGDACNKLTCAQCRRTWCWICKAKLGGRPYDHFSELGGRGRKCPQWGERPADQVFVQTAQPAVVRNHIERVGFLGNGTIGLGIVGDGCPRDPREGGGPIRHQREKLVCGWIKLNGEPCTFKGKARQGGVCGKHRRAKLLADGNGEWDDVLAAVGDL